MNVVQRAKSLATEAHASIGQVRKYTDDPYIVHPAAVVAIVKTVPHTQEMLAAVGSAKRRRSNSLAKSSRPRLHSIGVLAKPENNHGTSP